MNELKLGKVDAIKGNQKTSHLSVAARPDPFPKAQARVHDAIKQTNPRLVLSDNAIISICYQILSI